MARFYYGEDGKGKLVRDRLDEKIRSEGHEVKTRKLEPKVLGREILKKIPEELDELLAALNSGDAEQEVDELADLQTLIDSYIKARGLDVLEIERVKQAKTAAKGAFDEGTFIEYVDLNPDGDDYDFWCNHFRENSDRYIEKK